MTAIEAPLETYFRTLTDVNAADASDVVLELLDEGTPVERITTEVLAPAQVRVGQLWEQGRWSVSDEHAATAVTETALSALAAAASRRPAGPGRHVVVACAEGEWHTLPARMAATVGAADGLRVTFLGPSVPADHLGRRLAAGDVDLLALSCTLPPNLLGAASCVRAAHDAGVPVLAGGRAFGDTPRRAHAIGADGWAASPAALTQATPELTHGDPVIPPEAVLLDTVDDRTISLAYDLLVGAFPRLSRVAPYDQARTREDLRWMARFTGAAVLTDDASVLEEFLTWLCGLLDGPVPADVIAESARVVAEVVESFAPTGAQLLLESADGLLGTTRA
ncbi:cobalamin B12-binding domain-containing protein [soil metagenome]